jgi:hypothetical protein
VPSSWSAVNPRRLIWRSGSRSVGAGAGEWPWTRSTPGASFIRSPPPASSLVARIHALVPGASVTTEPATRPNQSNPLTALATSSAVARPHPPPTKIAQAATTPACTITIGTPSSSAWTRCSRTAASTRPPSTWRR